ncbi:hypothetical protein ACFVFS_27120 [Kitasatospora sp. NPDC057692]|uniref:hypothetical protein n=1 Tax=Kitasatospora sp. NPDC057692 TaxID=3346215 RepID=UPI003682AE61
MVRNIMGRARIPGAVVAALMLVCLAAPASSAAARSGPPAAAAVAATEYNQAVLGGPVHSTGPCAESAAGEACFQMYGDQVYLVANTAGAYARWSNYLWNGSSWQLYRQGECSISVVGTWGHCNKDFYEDSTSPNAYGSQGSGIRVAICTASGNCSAETWTRNNG